MNKPEFGNYNIILWQKLFNNIECEQIIKYYSNWTSNIDIGNKCNEIQQKIIHVETLFEYSYDCVCIAIKNNGNILISDYDNDCIRIFEKKDLIYHEVKRIIINKPYALAINSNDDIIVTSQNNIYLIKDDKITIIVGSDIAGHIDADRTNARFNLISAVAIHSDSTIYVSDMNNYCIREISKEGIVRTIAGSINQEYDYLDGFGTESRFWLPMGIAIKNNNIFIADSNNDSIRAINIKTKEVSTIFKGDISLPTYICVMKDQTIIIIDENCIKSINMNGDIKTIAGSIEGKQDGLGTIATFNNPKCIAIDAYDNIIVFDSENKKIRKLYYK
jgi:hypothetical protein